MHGTVRVALFLFLLAGAGCTTTGTTPATTPTSTAPVTTAVPGTVVTTTTSTTVATTTTTTVDRLTEIAAIFEDLERRRLQAIFDQDEEAFRAVHANKGYEELSLQVMNLLIVTDPQAASIHVEEVLEDSDECLAVRASIDLTTATEGGELRTNVHVIERSGAGWGFSWTGEGWRCIGPHPLSD
jgi:hypothetical protein